MSNIERIKELKIIYSQVFKSENGEAVLSDLAKRCFFKSTTFAADPATMAYREGQRSIYLHILTLLDMDIEALEKLNKKEE